MKEKDIAVTGRDMEKKIRRTSIRTAENHTEICTEYPQNAALPLN
jgi:hypothetical protein